MGDHRQRDPALVCAVIRLLGWLRDGSEKTGGVVTMQVVTNEVCQYIFDCAPEELGQLHTPASCCGEDDGCCCTCSDADALARTGSVA